MSLLKNIAEIEITMPEQIVYYNQSNDAVFFTTKRLAQSIGGSLRVNGAVSGWWVVNVVTTGNKPSAEVVGQVDEVFVTMKNPKNIQDVEEVLKCFGYGVLDKQSLIDAINHQQEHNNVPDIGFSAKNFYTEKYSKLEDGIELEAYPVNNVSKIVHNKTFPVDLYVKDISQIQDDKILINVPSDINGYVLSDEMKMVFPAIESVLNGKFGGMLRGMFHGIAGSGKTDFAKACAYWFGTDLVHVDCSIIVEPNQWFYRRAVKQGNTIDELTPLAQALLQDTDEPIVILLDEVSRNNPMVLNPLMQMLGEQKMITLGNEVHFYNRPVFFVITCNVGSQYTGTDLMDLALQSRMDFVIEMKPPKYELFLEIAESHNERFYENSIDEDVIKKVAQCAFEGMMYTYEQQIPELVTNREMLNVMKNIHLGMTLRSAVRFGMLEKQQYENRSHIEGIFNNIIL